MSTIDDSGKEPEQQTQPVAEAGCEGKVDRSVQGTVAATGFAELRARAIRELEEADKAGEQAERNGRTRRAWLENGKARAYFRMIGWLDAIEADAKDAS